MDGYIFNIQRFSLHDGPGIRTTVFLKGCNLNCIWCHNPESFIKQPQLSYVKEKCSACGVCQAHCPHSAHLVENGAHQVFFERCKTCGICVAGCPSSALTIIGYKISAEDVMREVLQDKAYYEESGGGVTFSGGEPVLQHKFLHRLLVLSKEAGLHTCLDTAGLFPPRILKKMLPLCDLFLYDYKMTDIHEHWKYTGVANITILNNLALLAKYKKSVILRCPIIPGINDIPEHYKAIEDLKNRYSNIIRIDYLPYHIIGRDKREQIGMQEGG